MSKINRVEIIDWTDDDRLGGGRCFVHWDDETFADIDLQDDGRTLKVFIKTQKEANGN
jgi:hypothetical protein